MMEIGKEINERAEKIFEHMDERYFEILFFQQIRNDNLRKKVGMLNSLRMDAIRAIQVGNVRHAIILLLIMEDILRRLDEIKETIRKDVSEAILKDA